MRAVVQRVSKASVEIEGKISGSISLGFLVLLGIHADDEIEDAEYLLKKITQLRVFADEAGLMNLSLADVGGNMLVVSQFTLHASTKKGNRPSFIQAARPEKAIPLYEYFLNRCKELGFDQIQSGTFGAMMNIDLCNEGPVTILIDSRSKE